MLAVDTNVLVRIIVADDPVQSPQARRLVAQNAVYVGRTVLLEVEWVLRGRYRLPRRDVHRHLSDIAGLPQVTLESPKLVAQALDWFGHGMDFADALHLAASEGCDAFASFDHKLAAVAKKARATKVKAL